MQFLSKLDKGSCYISELSFGTVIVRVFERLCKRFDGEKFRESTHNKKGEITSGSTVRDLFPKFFYLFVCVCPSSLIIRACLSCCLVRIQKRDCFKSNDSERVN